MRRFLIVFALVALVAGCEEQPDPAAASLLGEGTVRRGVGPECPDTWAVETGDGERLWPVDDAALQIDGLRVYFGASPNEGAMGICMAGKNVSFTLLERIDPAPTPSPAAAGIWSTSWRLADLGGDGVIADAEATLEFPEEGRAVGRGSCNRFFAIVAVEGDSMRFSGIGSTKMACAEPISTQETKYLKALESAERFAIEGDELVVHSSALPAPLRFTRASS